MAFKTVCQESPRLMDLQVFARIERNLLFSHNQGCFFGKTIKDAYHLHFRIVVVPFNACIRRVAQRLEKDGLLLLTDIVREEDESLPVYLRRYCDWLRSDWSALDAEEKASACDHILNNDRPETFSVLQALAQAGELGEAVTVARYGCHRVLCFRRPAE